MGLALLLLERKLSLSVKIQLFFAFLFQLRIHADCTRKCFFLLFPKVNTIYHRNYPPSYATLSHKILMFSINSFRFTSENEFPPFFSSRLSRFHRLAFSKSIWGCNWIFPRRISTRTYWGLSYRQVYPVFIQTIVNKFTIFHSFHTIFNCPLNQPFWIFFPHLRCWSQVPQNVEELSADRKRISSKI